MASRIADLMIKLGATDTELIKAFKNAEYQLGKLSKSLISTGKTMSMTFTAPLTAMAALSVKAADTQIKAEAKVAQAIKSTGAAAKLSLEELKAYASELQENSLFGDEEILDKVTAQLLTFTNIASSEFKRTQQVALDLSTLLNGDLKSASIQLGKALNDPVANLSALSRSGIQFTDEQKEVINMLAETNRLADAQNIILTELERQYGGQAKAAVTALGPSEQLANSWGDFMEMIGERLLPFVNQFTEMLTSVVNRLKELNPEMLDTIVVVGGIVAAIGPLSIGLGTVIKMLPLMASGLAVILSPIGLVAAAIMALAAAFGYAAIKKKLFIADLVDNNSLEELQNKLGDNRELQAQEASKKQRVGRAGIKSTNSQQLESEEKLLVQAIEAKTKAIEADNKAMEESLQLQKEINEAIEKATEDTKKMLEAANTAKLTDSMQAQKDNGYDQALVISPVASIGAADSQVFMDAMEATNNAIGVYISDLNDKRKEYSNALIDFNVQMMQVMEQLRSTTEQFIESAVSSLASGIGQIITGDIGIEDLAMTLVEQFGNFISTLGQILIETGIAMKAFQASIKTLFATPGAAIIAGIALVATGTAIASAASSQAESSIPALASGGLAYGETYALIGDNPNANIDPEVVAPLSKLQQIMGSSTGSQNINVTLDGSFKLKSSDLQLALNKNNYRVSISK